MPRSNDVHNIHSGDRPSNLPPDSDRTCTLRNTAYDFCTALTKPLPPDELLSRFCSATPKITEHGPAWASSRLPFLGKTFSGKDGCMTYFKLLADTLAMKLAPDAFPAKDGFIVDAGAGAVSVVGHGRFQSKKTGEGWNEHFIHRLSDFDSEGRIGHWEIWADPLSAWVAVSGGHGGEKGDGRTGDEGVLDGEGYAS